MMFEHMLNEISERLKALIAMIRVVISRLFRLRLAAIEIIVGNHVPGSSGFIIDQPQGVALGGDASIYVTNRGGEASIVVYAPEPTMNIAPVRTITSSDLEAPFGIAIDGRDKIFVAETGRDSVLVFETGATGNVIPLRRIQGSNADLKDPQGIAVRMF